MTEPAKKVVAVSKAAAATKASPTKASPTKASPTKAAAPKSSGSAKAASSKRTARTTGGPQKKGRSAKPASAKKAGARALAAKEAQAKARSAASSRFFKRATDRARRIANDPEKLREIAEKADRTSMLRSGPFAAVLDEFRVLIRLVVAYARGHYRQIALDKLVLVVGGLIYVVSPLDAIPDAIPGIGFLDDASVIAWVIKSVREELDAFRQWEVGLTD
jgi:uncharacterized membrane protein YkvA (DUF1232 family)